jgi:uncharacterized protein (TIGR02996 family)
MMDEERLLVALNETPGDPVPRLAYAAWLEERGDPRSEYFRVEDRLRKTPLGDPSRRILGRDWRERRATLDPAWLARVEPGAPVPAWVPIEVRRPPRVGLDDWHEWARQSHYEWVVLATLAPIEAVVRAVIEVRLGSDPDSALASGVWRRGVPVQRGEQHERGSPGIPFVQLTGHAWTVAMYDTFHLSLTTYHAAQDDARELSDRLGTLAVEYSAEDTSSATGYHLYECGELIEFAEDAPGEARFASRRRPLPWTAAPRNFPDDLFRALGLYLPGFYAGGTGIRLGVPEPGDFTRADLLRIGWQYREDRLEGAIRRNDGFAEIHRLYDEGYDPEGGLAGDEDEVDIPF